VSISGHGRDGGEIEAIQVDRYLESLLSRRPVDPTIVDPTIAATAHRLRDALPRFHPSFIFEERLAQRLRGPSGDPVVIRALHPSAAPVGVDRAIAGRPILVGSVLTSAALSLAGAAYVAWRFRRPASPMRQAIRSVARARVS